YAGHWMCSGAGAIPQVERAFYSARARRYSSRLGRRRRCARHRPRGRHRGTAGQGPANGREILADNDTAIAIVTLCLSRRIGAGSVTGQIDKTINDLQGSGATLTERKELPMGRSVDARTDTRPSQYLEFSAITIKKRSIALFLMRLPALIPWIFVFRGWVNLNAHEVLTNTEADVLEPAGGAASTHTYRLTR